MSGTARDEDSDDRNRGNREKHSGRSKQGGASDHADHDDERMKFDRATENERLVDGVLEQLRERHRGHDPDREGVGADERDQRMNLLGQERIGEAAEQRRKKPAERDPRCSRPVKIPIAIPISGDADDGEEDQDR